MLKVVEIAMGVTLGIFTTMFLIWAITCVTQYLSGDRYFTPSRHIITERFLDKKNRKKKVSKVDIPPPPPVVETET